MTKREAERLARRANKICQMKARAYRSDEGWQVRTVDGSIIDLRAIAATPRVRTLAGMKRAAVTVYMLYLVRTG